MQPNISGKIQITLAGVSFFGDPFELRPGWDEENEIGRLWKRFSHQSSKLENDIFSDTNAGYEVHITTDETLEKGTFEVFVGMRLDLDRLELCPPEFCIKVLPETQYAVFTFQGDQIVSDWEKAIQEWMAASLYLSTHSYNFQYYDARFKGMDRLDDSIIDVYVPVAEKA